MATTIRRRRADEPKTAPGADRYRGRADDDDDDDTTDDEEESPRARRRREREEDPEPRARRRRDEDDDDDDEDSPRRGRTAKKADPDDDDDDDDDDDPRARRRRARSRDDDDDDDEPRRSRRRVDDDDDDDDEPRSRRRRVRDDDEDDDLPSRNGKPKASSGGWGAWNKKRRELGNFANEVRVPDDAQILVKFLDDEPFCTYGIHWLTLSQGRRSFVCLETDCPLCDRLGDSPKAMAAFNTLVIDEGTGEAKLLVWAAGPGVTQDIELASKAKTGPLTREYYAVSKSKSGRNNKGPVRYKIEVVRGRDLREEWGIKPLSETVLAKFEAKMYDEEKYLKRPTRSELKAVAREAMDDED